MGALAEGMVAYAQPLLDQTDGSLEQVNNAFAITHLCYNLALLPDAQRDQMLREVWPSLGMDDQEFDTFRRDIIVPMIRRHEEMFPRMYRGVYPDPGQSSPSLRAPSSMAESTEAYPGTDRYAPCPCNSGEKYKFCCGKKRR